LRCAASRLVGSELGAFAFEFVGADAVVAGAEPQLLPAEP
jgi:hypothetical protein